MLACLIGLSAALAAAPVDPAKTGETLTLEQRKKMLELHAELRRPTLPTADWLAKADELSGLGELGRRRAVPLVRLKVDSLRRTYQAAFVAQAKKTLLSRVLAVAEQEGKKRDDLGREIQTARRTVGALVHDGGLSKERIVKEGDPAMRRLEQLLQVEPPAVLDADEKVRTQREQLLAVAALGDRLEPAAKGAGTFEATLGRWEQLAVLLAIPNVPTGDRRVLLENIPLARQLKDTEADGIRDLNRIRLLLGMHALRIDPKLCKAARGHSTDMREKGFFSHDSPVPGKRTPWDRARLAGTSASGENIASGASTGKAVIQMWWHSPGHFKNMLGGARRIGLGHDGPWTQMFGS